MRSRLRLTVAVGAALLVAGCGSGEPRDGEDLPQSHTVRQEDDGSTVRLQVGDTLTVDLTGDAGLRWDVLSYPKDLLRLQERDAATARFVFEAVAEGEGRIDVAADCPPPLPGADGGPGCPIGGADDGQEPATREPLPLFSVLVQVTAGA